ncbi:MAG: leucine-rich repeat protein [Clostridia bacterium]|nr:leucine-rich repeat protein [Clostridia bacterium]
MKKIFISIKEKTIKAKEKLKAMPKKKLAIIIVVTLLSLILITAGIVALCIRTPGEESQDTENKTQDVFSSTPPTDENKNQNGNNNTPQSANELLYVSNGDGTCCISGLGTYRDTEVKIPAKSPSGEVVEEISAEAFANCKEIVTITIPATVKYIGDKAFIGCSSLIAIYVSSSNNYYCSVGGVLFSEDKTSLVCYPQMRPGVKYLLPTSVKVIEAYAFDGVKDLCGLLYEESISKYQKIEIKEGNSILNQISVTCNYIPSKP